MRGVPEVAIGVAVPLRVRGRLDNGADPERIVVGDLIGVGWDIPGERVFIEHPPLWYLVHDEKAAQLRWLGSHELLAVERGAAPAEGGERSQPDPPAREARSKIGGL